MPWGGGVMKEGRIPGREALLLSHANRENGSTEYSQCGLLDYNIQSDTGYQRYCRRHCSVTFTLKMEVVR
jgi:hypothetical protein